MSFVLGMARERMRHTRPIRTTAMASVPTGQECPQCGGPVWDVTLALSCGPHPLSTFRSLSCGHCTWAEEQ